MIKYKRFFKTNFYVGAYLNVRVYKKILRFFLRAHFSSSVERLAAVFQLKDYRGFMLFRINKLKYLRNGFI